jgi:serine protease Do
VSRGLSSIGLAALLAAGIAGGVGLAARVDRDAESPKELDPALILQGAFNRAAAIATKAVVHITISDGRGSDNVGSGVIVTPQGHILTNYHVVRDSLKCKVRFVDGKQYLAQIKGRDPDSDLAVLVIDAPDRKLDPIAFADSDRVRVGDVVFAVGSPFGYTHTVTSGIVSAKHRRVELGKPYEDYLQTDAAINPGNSGGALVNLKGELVGINSAMVSGSRTNDGVGLAIASNLVKWVQERLIRDGEVRRGYLGIKISDVDYDKLRNFLAMEPEFGGVHSQADLEKALGMTDAAGTLVMQVLPGTPAEQIGLKRFDVILEIDGRPVRNQYELVLRVVELEPGRQIKFKFLRGQKKLDGVATLEDRRTAPPQ